MKKVYTFEYRINGGGGENNRGVGNCSGIIGGGAWKNRKWSFS